MDIWIFISSMGFPCSFYAISEEIDETYNNMYLEYIQKSSGSKK